MTYIFKSSTSKRKNNKAFAEKIWKAFNKETQGAYKTQSLSIDHKENAILCGTGSYQNVRQPTTM